MARSGRTILVVSDDPVTVFSTWAILFHGNYRVQVAGNRARAGKLANEPIDVARITRVRASLSSACPMELSGAER